MKIFYITSRIPYPIDKGDKLRAYHQLKLLSRNHDIFLFCTNDEKDQQILPDELKSITVGQRVHHLSKLKIGFNLVKGLLNDIPLQTAYFYSSDIKKDLEKEIKKFQPDIIVCQLIRTAEYLKNISDIPVVIDYVDVLSKGLKLRSSLANPFYNFFISMECERVLKYEEKVFNRFGHAMIITDNDKEALPIDNKNEIAVIPNGIDIDYYTPENKEKDIDLLFVGNMSYPPNINAVRHFVQNVFPTIQKKFPEIKFYIVGASPVAQIKNLSSKNIVVTGWVDDIREYYNRAKIFIAPMNIGTGLQNKILEAMSMKTSCVISELAQKGIQADENKSLLIAKNDLDFTGKVIELLDNSEMRSRISEEARSFIINNYDWRQIGEKLEEFLQSIVEEK